MGERASAVVLGHTRWASIGIISQPNAHPVDSLELGRRGRPLRHGGAQRRRRQLRRPQGGRRPPRGRRDHHRREGDPHPRLPPPGRGGGARRRLPRHRGQLRGLGGHRGQQRLAPRTTCCWRCGAVGRRSTSAWRTGATSSPPSPTAWSSSRRRTSGWTATPRRTSRTRTPAAARSSCSTAAGPGRSRASSARPTTAPSSRSATADLHAAQVTTRDIDRGDYSHFLLKEITEAPSSFRKTLRGRLVDRDGQLRVALDDDVLAPTLRAALRDGRIEPRADHRAGDRPCRGPEPGRRAGGRRARRRPPARRSPPRHRALRVRAARGHVRHAGHRHQPVRDDDRHEPHRRPRPSAGRHRRGHRQPARRRPHRQERRRALHLRRPRRGDERGVDEGVLRPDRGRVPAGLGDRRGGRRHRRPGARRGPAGRPRRHGGDDRPPAPDRRGRPAAGAVQALLGDRGQRHQPHRGRGAAHQAERALLPIDRLRRHGGQEAHRPLVRAARARVRGRPRGVHGGRRRQGGGDLPGPQGLPDRDRER